MPDSVWSRTLREFRERVAGTARAPAGVATACVTAALGMSLLIKVLEIAGRRKAIPREWIGRAQRIAADLALAADEDTAAVLARDVAKMSAIPPAAARAAGEGIELCAEAAPRIDGAIAADLAAAAHLLRGAMDAIRACTSGEPG